MKTREGKFRALFAFVVGQPREDIDGSPFETYEEAALALDGLLSELRARGTRRCGLLLAKAAERALDLREKEGYRSIDSERDRWHAYFEDKDLAQTPIAEISRGWMRDILAGLMNQKTGKSLGVSTKQNILNLVRAILAVAVDDEKLAENPLIGMRIKKRGSTEEEMRPLMLDQLNALLKITNEVEPAVAIKAGCGMRSGEMRSLRWEDVDLGADPHVLARYGAPGLPRKNGIVLRVPLFGIALDAFRSMKRKKSGIVFPAKRGGYRAKGQLFDRLAWKKWLVDAGISRRVRPHDLRHTCATLLLNGAWGIKWTYEAVKEQLGHSSVKVTERYAKVLGTLATKTAASMRKKGSRKGSATHEAIVAQAREMLERRGSDSNRRMTVLQSQLVPIDLAEIEAIAILRRSWAEAIVRNDPLAHAFGLRFAEAQERQEDRLFDAIARATAASA